VDKELLLNAHSWNNYAFLVYVNSKTDLIL